MTTIACDGVTMAGDGQVMVGWTITETDAVKVRRLDDGRVYGCSGDATDKAVFKLWLETSDNDASKQLSEGFAALVLHASGKLEWFTNKLIPIECSAPQAIGCGREFALAAMDAGCSAYRAVEIAAKRCAGTGGLITSLTIRPECEPVGDITIDMNSDWFHEAVLRSTQPLRRGRQ